MTDAGRRWRPGWLVTRLRALSLSQRFFAVALLIVFGCMIALGGWIGNYLATGIVRGVGETAAASIESLIVTRTVDGDPSTELATGLDSAFQIASSSASSRLLQIRIRDLDGGILYQSLGGIVDQSDPQALRRAAEGMVETRVQDLQLMGVGDLPGSSIPVLKIYTPLRQVDTDMPFAVAELYLSARAVREIQTQAQVDVWIIVASIGFIAIGLLAAIIDATGNIIGRHRLALARNLLATRRLLEENRSLHHSSEDLRIQAAVANERLLTRVGSDIHDGPLQLVTLMILRLTRHGSTPVRADIDAAIACSTEAMEQLRAISSGLVLPELNELSLEESVQLAIRRHESQTGRSVGADIALDDAEAGIDVKVCAYRFVQECLSNAFRHGDGPGETVSARLEGGTVVIACANPVRAVDTAKEHQDRDHLGLQGMRIRIRAIGGTLAVQIGPRLAHLEARIPLRPGASLI